MCIRDRINNGWVGNVRHLNALLTVPTKCFHFFYLEKSVAPCAVADRLRLSESSDCPTRAALTLGAVGNSAIPEDWPSIVATSPVSISCLKRLRSSLIALSILLPNNSVTVAPTTPPGGL